MRYRSKTVTHATRPKAQRSEPRMQIEVTYVARFAVRGKAAAGVVGGARIADSLSFIGLSFIAFVHAWCVH